MFPVRGRTRIGGPFGAVRADTGSHQGNDLFAEFGTPVVAVADGTVENVGSLKISGNRLWVYADGGDQFFYAHLSAFRPDAVDDTHVEAGTCSATSATPATPSRRRRTCTSRSTRTAATPSTRNPFLVAWLARAGGAATDTAERPGALVEVRDLIGDG